MIAEGKTGNCHVRKNISGKLQLLTFNKTLTMTIDPIEKKPLFHFKPGTHCLSISTFGCNFHCLQCQNFEISQEFSEQAIEKIPETTPEQIVQRAILSRSQGIAYTYTEPTVFAEYALETMKLAHKKGLYNVWVSNGYMTREVIDTISQFLDAINIDLKGNARFYKEVCGNAEIEKVKDNINYFARKKIHQEITYLIIPGHNDNVQDIKEACDFLAGIDKNIPLHFSRFFPLYKMQDKAITQIETLQRAKEIAEATGLQFVYIGNIGEEENSFCPKCKNKLVQRLGYDSSIIGLDAKARCKKCCFQTNFLF
jgi:pyruvate formate lyase activating enzyme